MTTEQMIAVFTISTGVGGALLTLLATIARVHSRASDVQRDIREIEHTMNKTRSLIESTNRDMAKLNRPPRTKSAEILPPTFQPMAVRHTEYYPGYF